MRRRESYMIQIAPNAEAPRRLPDAQANGEGRECYKTFLIPPKAR